jgi:hypothetical protein
MNWGFIFQKTAFFIGTAVKTSDLFSSIEARDSKPKVEGNIAYAT